MKTNYLFAREDAFFDKRCTRSSNVTLFVLYISILLTGVFSKKKKLSEIKILITGV